MGGISRRRLLAGGLGAATLVAAGPAAALTRPLGPAREFGTGRRSRLDPRQALVHADLHNHSLQSDGAGDPARAFASLRGAGLDVAALTDHTVLARDYPGVCDPFPHPEDGDRDPCTSLFGLDDEAWEATRAYADAASTDGVFAALRGFEWSSPYLGHMNVWGSEDWTDPLSTAGFTAAGLALLGYTEPLLRGAVAAFGDLGEQLVDEILASTPASPTLMSGFYDWLAAAGPDVVAGFNHPNREPLAFDAFAYDARLRDRIVSLEILNRREDYLFKGFADGRPSPLVACLDEGWHVGLLGVTDEHGTDWGEPDGKGRAGLYVDALTRDGVTAALRSRRVFATRQRGLRLDATANGRPMGGVQPARRAPVRFAVDLDRGELAAGAPVEVQVLASGGTLPEVLHVEEAVLPSPRDPRPLRFTVPVDPAEHPWVVLRIADPTRPNDAPGPDGHPCNNAAIAYASPFYLSDTGRPRRRR